MSKIMRVFPRRTAATPNDDMVRIAVQPGLFDEADEIQISVTFTWDLPVAERLAYLWETIAPTRIGGPAAGERGGDFTPGMYIKKGYVLTSRGCPNKCWFCSVPKREGQLRELPITEGYNLLDDNILACSDSHISKVFEMLAAGKKKYKKPVEFTGGLEAARLKPWHVEKLRELRPQQMFFAYDTPDDLEPLVQAGRLLEDAGWTVFPNGGRSLRCYVLCGYPKDTIMLAEKRMHETIAAGFMPMAMLYRDSNGKRSYDWMKWQRLWARPAIMSHKRWIEHHRLMNGGSIAN